MTTPGAARPPRPAGRYVAATWAGESVVTAGMTPRGPDEVLLARGVVGVDVDVDRARELAAAAADRAIAAVAALVDATLVDATLVSLEPVDAALGDRAPAVALGGGQTALRDAVPTDCTVYVRSAPTFEQHSAVADGASERIAAAFGGRLPARAAVGVTSLPGGAPVEVVLRVHVPGVSPALPTVTTR